jgi:hypothetical protein
MKLPGVVTTNPEVNQLWQRQYRSLERGEVLPECLREENLSHLNYRSLTILLGRAFEALAASPSPALFKLIGRLLPMLGVRWEQSNKARPPRLSAPEEAESGSTPASDTPQLRHE